LGEIAASQVLGKHGGFSETDVKYCPRKKKKSQEKEKSGNFVI